MKKIKIKHVGNHWYLDIEHNSLDDISLDYKLEKYLSFLRKEDSDEYTIFIYESGSIVYNNSLQFSEESINRYFTTNDEFNLKFWIGDKSFEISSNLYYLLECQFGFNFHDTAYRIELCHNIY